VLVGREVEQPIPRDRTAERSTVLVAIQAVGAALAIGTEGGEWIRGVHRVIAEELEDSGVKRLVGVLGGGPLTPAEPHASNGICDISQNNKETPTSQPPTSPKTAMGSPPIRLPNNVYPA
jgi:hypothetical protein